MKSKWTLWVALLALGIAAAAVTHAQGRPEGPAPGVAPRAPAGEVEMGDGLEGLDMPGAGAGDLEEAGPDDMRGMRGAGAEDMRKKLNLSDDQRTKLADIRDRQARAAIPIRSDLEIAGLDLRKLMRAEKPDQKAIDAQIDKMASLRARLQKSRVASRLESRAVLTPEQQKILRESRPGLGRVMRRGRGMRGMEMGGPGTRM